MKILETAGLLLGSTVLVMGLGISAISASQKSFPGVFIGFVLFVAGYKVSQFVARGSEETEVREVVDDIVKGSMLIDFLVTLVGVGTIGYGFILLFESLKEVEFVIAAAASGIMFTGYVMAHYGVNRTVV